MWTVWRSTVSTVVVFISVIIYCYTLIFVLRNEICQRREVRACFYSIFLFKRKLAREAKNFFGGGEELDSYKYDGYWEGGLTLNDKINGLIVP